MTRSSMLRLYALEPGYEAVKVWRTPGYTIPAITFPLAFYLLFAILIRPGGRSSLSGLAVYLVATYGACGLMGAALQSFGVGLAIERGPGWLQVKRAAPMPLAAYFTAKLAMVLAFGVAIVGGLALLAIVGGGVRPGGDGSQHGQPLRGHVQTVLAQQRLGLPRCPPGHGSERTPDSGLRPGLVRVSRRGRRPGPGR